MIFYQAARISSRARRQPKCAPLEAPARFRLADLAFRAASGRAGGVSIAWLGLELGSWAKIGRESCLKVGEKWLESWRKKLLLDCINLGGFFEFGEFGELASETGNRPRSRSSK